MITLKMGLFRSVVSGIVGINRAGFRSAGCASGGVISPFLYLIYKNDLLYEIEASALGFCMYDINCG